MEDQHTNHIEELLPRYCDGNVTEEERQMVEEWINASDENKKIAKQIFSINLRIDTEKALKKVTGKMIVKKRRIWWEWTQRAAAILFIPLLAAFLVQQFSRVAETEQIAQIMEIKTNPGMTTSVTLSDGTVVYLNSESSLSYPVRFDGNTREVYLEGEAYFEVAKDPAKRFVVSTIHQLQVEVLGTRFNMEAYEAGDDVITTLVEGKVNFLFKQHEQPHSIVLTPGQKLVYNSKEDGVHLYSTSCESEISWKDGMIVLKETPLQEALRMLEKRYHVQFVINNKKGLNDTFTGTFTNERLERILDLFKISSKIRWRYMESTDISEKKTQIEIY